MTRRIILSAASGALLVLAFPPIGFSYLAWTGLVPFFFALYGRGNVTHRNAFSLGFIFGFVFFLGTVYWVVHSMHMYGGIGLTLSIPIMLLLVAYLSVYAGVYGFCLNAARFKAPFFNLIFSASLWASLEYARGYFLTGLPWSLLGYTQTPVLPVVQIADITGVWGVSFLVVLGNYTLYFVLEAAFKRDKAPALKEIAFSCIVFAAVIGYGLFMINSVDLDASGWRPFKVGVAQGSIEQQMKWEESFASKTIDIYRALSVEAGGEPPDVVVWPESAAPFFLEADTPQGNRLRDAVRDAGTYVLTGSIAYNSNPATGATSYFNSAYLLDPNGGITGRYDKFHLVPFGEYVPKAVKRFLPFVKKLTAGAGDFSEGPGPNPLSLNKVKLGILICYEAIFPDISRRETKNGAGVLVNITNDAWFGYTSAPYQHFQMSVMRSVENRRYLVRSANTGISAIVDPVGRVIKRTALFERTILTGTIGIKDNGLSFYTRYGDVFVYALIAVSCILLLAAVRGMGKGR